MSVGNGEASNGCPLAFAMSELAQQIAKIGAEYVPINSIAGRVLAANLVADRDSPACDVSAMDGYAILRESWRTGVALQVAGECVAGQPAIALGDGQAAKIFTGAPIPFNADTVVQRELAKEDAAGHVTFDLADSELVRGRSVRRQGENVRAGEIVLKSGSLLTPTAMAIAATFAPAQVNVRQTLAVSVINTGSELVEPGMPAEAWQIRDSNGLVIESLLKRLSFVDAISRRSVPDDPLVIRGAIADALEHSQVILLSGGVSVGDYDHVPAILRELGVRTIFHRLPIRPGKPVFGGVGPDGQLICGLPGNPVSVAVTARRIALPLMKIMAGMNDSVLAGEPVAIKAIDDGQKLPLVWFRLIRRAPEGTIELVTNQGSGDLVSLGISDGFIESNPFDEQPSHTSKLYLWG